MRRWATAGILALSTSASAWELEAGPYVGAVIPSSRHELYDPRVSSHLPLGVGPQFGLRADFFPIAPAGVEAEADVAPLSVSDRGGATLGSWRLSFVGRIPLKAVRPMLMLGVGHLALASGDDVLGSDVDGAVHWGLGADVPIGRRWAIRADFRHLISRHEGRSDVPAHHFLANAAFEFRLDNAREPIAEPAIVDQDHDGITDAADGCPTKAELINGFEDADGCPEADADRDGLFDTQDECPDQGDVTMGVRGEHGCPPADTDRDGLPDPVDHCPTAAETPNQYEDSDGCPDEIPVEVKKFTGVIDGVFFDHDSALLRDVDQPALAAAAKVLVDYPAVRIRIIGHTDNVGSLAYNMELSVIRAESVRKYLTEHGVDAARMEVEGRGATQPLDSNDTDAGRAKNRRVEFLLVD